METKPNSLVCLKETISLGIKMLTGITLFLTNYQLTIAQDLLTKYPETDGVVTTMVQHENILYVGGQFSKIYSPDSTAPYNRNSIFAMDIITGHILNWQPTIMLPSAFNIDATVSTLKIKGNQLFIGGDFSHIDGEARNNLAIIDINTRTLTSWQPPQINSSIKDMEIAGDTLFMIGYFDSIAGQKRKTAGAININTNVATSWSPYNGLYPTAFFDLALAGDTLYLATRNGQIGSPSYIYAYNTHTGSKITDASISCNGVVYCMEVSGNFIYVGGSYTDIGGRSRDCFAEIDRQTRQATAFQPAINGINRNVNKIVLSPTTIYVSGGFTSIGGADRDGFAALGRTSGLASDFDIKPNDRVTFLFISGNTLFTGGPFTTLYDSIPRSRLAAFGFQSQSDNLSVSADTVYLNRQESSIQVFSNTNWSIINTETWFDITPKGGTGNVTLTIQYTDTENVDKEGFFSITTGGMTETVYVIKNAVTAVSEIEDQTHIDICPNPVTDILSIRTYVPLKLPYYKITSIEGETVLSGKLANGPLTEVNIKELTPGLYFLQLENSITHKILKLE